MSINPYESSESYPPPQQSREAPITFERRRSSGRPVGVVILAVLHFLHGLFIAGIIGIALVAASDYERAQLISGIGFTLFVIGLTIAIGVGLWKGENWGWRCASFYYVAQVAQPVLNWLSGRQPGSLSAMEAIVGIGCFIFLFSDSVLHYFGMFGIRKLPTAGRIIGICAVLFTILTWLN